MLAMKKVLIVGYIYPYHPRAGARIPGLARYLSEFGWQPTVLTAPLGDISDSPFGPLNDLRNSVRVIETYQYSPMADVGVRAARRFDVTSRKSYEYAKPLLLLVYKLYLDLFRYPDVEKSWKPVALGASNELLAAEHFDALISTSPPVISHIVGEELKIEHRIPWIADFPHLWSQDHSYPYSSWRRLTSRKLEVKTLSRADALVTISGPHAEKLEALHKGKPTYAITHGFDPASMDVSSRPSPGKFTITYTGSFAPGLRDPCKFFGALRNLISQGTVDSKDVEVRFYGRQLSWIDREIEQYGLSGVVKQHGAVPISVSWEKQRESQLLLVPKWEDPQEQGAYSMKIFEYLAARRPILAVGGHHDVVDEVLDETKAGICAPGIGDVENALRESYREYKSGGEVAYGGDMEKINRYSHREMARKFSEILNNLVRDA